MDEDKKEKFRTKIVKKGLVFAGIQYAAVEVYLPLMFPTCTFETVKSCISLFLLLANLCFPGVRQASLFQASFMTENIEPYSCP